MRLTSTFRGSRSALAAPAAARRATPGRAAPTAPRAMLDGGMESALFGQDFGARDATAGEIESNFSDKVLGNYDTNHIIKPPEAMKEIMGLAARACVPGAPLVSDETELNRLLKQVPGWRLADGGTNAAGGAGRAIACDWRASSPEAGAELAARVAAAGAAAGHAPAVRADGAEVRAELMSAAAGGLSENDFIVAAKLNDLPLADLLPKPRVRYWA